MFDFKGHSRLTVLLIGFAVIVCSGVGCQPPQKQAGPPEKVTIAHATAPNSAIVHIAFVKGYFTEEGLEATPQPYVYGKQTLDAVIEGKADLGTVSDTPIMFAIMGGRKIMVLSVIQTSYKNEAIVARRDRGITKPADLRGKKIGVTLGTACDFFTHIFLEAHGIERTQVKIIDMKPEEIPSALRAGRIDAACIWNPLLTLARNELGDKEIVFYGESLFTETFCLTAGQDFVMQHPETIRKVLRALIKAENFIREQPAEARRIAAEFAKMDRAILDEIWGDFNFRVALDQSLLVDLEDLTRWAIDSGLTKRRDVPNYLDFIYIDGLKAVKPEAVRITR
jgi:sulfonate transport system substrate-binding protein